MQMNMYFVCVYKHIWNYFEENRNLRSYNKKAVSSYMSSLLAERKSMQEK